MSAKGKRQVFLKQQGFNLIEILISLFIISLALLGLDAISIHTLRDTKTTYYFNAAIQQLNNLIEQLNITSQDELQNILNNWNKQNQEILPHGHGAIINNRAIIYWGNYPQTNCEKNTIGTSGCLSIKTDYQDLLLSN